MKKPKMPKIPKEPIPATRLMIIFSNFTSDLSQVTRSLERLAIAIMQAEKYGVRDLLKKPAKKKR